MTLHDLDSYLKELFQPALFQDFCPNGVQVEGRKEIRQGAFAVSASLNVIQEAAQGGADFLFTHHGIFWNKDPYPLTGVKKEKIKTLLSHDMSLISYHLPLDAHPLYGNNWRAALDLGWKELAPFAGIGVKGRIDPISREDFQKTLESYYGHAAHTVFGGAQEISTVALISGGAHREISQAAREGVDCFITGSFDEPVWHIAHEERVNFFAIGHSASERVGPRAVMKHLEEKFGLKVWFIEESNPF